MTDSLKILFVAAEASPFVKVGGLGDVIGSLPKALHRAGHQPIVVLPRYGTIRSDYPISRHDSFSIPFIGRPEKVEIIQVALADGTPVYLVENARYFDRMAVYGEYDDAERFLFFSKVALEIPKRLGWQPDVVHCHDWHTAICPAVLQTDYRTDPFYAGCGSVYTIHNLAYQGSFHESFVSWANLADYLIPPVDPFRKHTFNMMAIGIYYSDVVTTVSETYAREALTPEYGCGLEGLLKARQDSFFGILNGIDYEEFNPATDPLIAAPYDAAVLHNKMENKLALQEKVGLPPNREIPLVGMAGRLVYQKGPDIAAQALETLLPEANVQFILQGTGETQYRQLLEKVEQQNTRKARLFFTLDFSLAQLIYAGCDIFLLPSRFEPCGLAPMIALRYGTIPVVRRTGGMAETVPDCSPDLSTGLGFAFDSYDSGELLMALHRALAGYSNREQWQKLVRRGMTTDFSWQASVPRYEIIYHQAMRRAREKHSG